MDAPTLMPTDRYAQLIIRMAEIGFPYGVNDTVSRMLVDLTRIHGISKMTAKMRKVIALAGEIARKPEYLSEPGFKIVYEESRDAWQPE